MVLLPSLVTSQAGVAKESLGSGAESSVAEEDWREAERGGGFPARNLVRPSRVRMEGRFRPREPVEEALETEQSSEMEEMLLRKEEEGIDDGFLRVLDRLGGEGERGSGEGALFVSRGRTRMQTAIL
eukprot:14336607-Ditylum_brightwellii.AAC.1